MDVSHREGASEDDAAGADQDERLERAQDDGYLLDHLRSRDVVVTVSCVDCLMLVDTAATPANVHVSCRVERRLHVLVDRRNRTVRHHQDEVNRADAEDVLVVRCTLADTALSIILRWTDARASLKARRRSLTRWCLAVLARTRDVCPVLVVDVGLHAWRAAAVVVRQGFVRPFLL